MKSRLQLRLRGMVQGVGFRPYVYNLAIRHGLAGFVLNAARGVLIEVEGEPAALKDFLRALPAEAPPLVRIAALDRSEIPPVGDTSFVIRASEADASAFSPVPPDICVCEECLAESRDPANRRFEYPFTNCTNCGPRYSIILDVPYDRPLTTMAEFAMCEDCRREYEDPANRRFHAQPNACPVCGPRLVAPDHPESLSSRAILEQTADVLAAGGIVAWKGLGGYQLACDARQESAVQELRRRKRRSEKPFAIMVADADTAATLCFVSASERLTLASPERPVVLLRRRPDAGLAPAVSPANPTTGVMLPCTPMHDLLFRILSERWKTRPALVMTSGNISEEPIAVDNADAEQRLAGTADIFVHHNRRIHTRVDDSVVRIAAGGLTILRRARGYAPVPLWLGLGEAEILACGAQQKNTLCLTRAGFALLSQHLGDLENFETLQFFEQTLERMSRLFHVHPAAVAHDLHPGYLSTQFAAQFAARHAGLTQIGVQHHHAHIAACMAEHQLQGRVIGVAWDGTGFGTDNTIWGGEFLAADYIRSDRYARLRPLLLAGGDSAVREPWRLARAALLDAFDGALPPLPALSPVAQPAHLRIVDEMLRRRVRTIPTSSAGRLFDAVASIIGLRHAVSFEGQAAMMLEAAADEWSDPVASPYDFTLDDTAPIEVDLRPTIRSIAEDVLRGETQPCIAARFHATLAAAIRAICCRMRSELQLDRVCLSGGCFQNARLLESSIAALSAAGFEVFSHRDVPANDGGIALGQAAIACATLRQPA